MVPAKKSGHLINICWTNEGMNFGRHHYRLFDSPHLKLTVLNPVHWPNWTIDQFLDVTWIFLSPMPLVTPVSPSSLPFLSLSIKMLPILWPASNAIFSMKPFWLLLSPQLEITVPQMVLITHCLHLFSIFFMYNSKTYTHI